MRKHQRLQLVLRGRRNALRAKNESPASAGLFREGRNMKCPHCGTSIHWSPNEIDLISYHLPTKIDGQIIADEKKQIGFASRQQVCPECLEPIIYIIRGDAKKRYSSDSPDGWYIEWQGTSLSAYLFCRGLQIAIARPRYLQNCVKISKKRQKFWKLALRPARL